MKKFLALILAALMCITVFVACDAEKKVKKNPRYQLNSKLMKKFSRTLTATLSTFLTKASSL